MSRITSGSDRLSPVGSVTTRSAATASRLILALMLAGELLVGWGADAQTPERIHRVGFIGVSPSSSAHPAAHLQPLRDALHQRGWIEGEWGPSENNRRARYYKLTRAGRAQLVEEKRNWYRMTSAMNWMLESEG